jgi:hypothetical protein
MLIMAQVVFSGNYPYDSDGAAEALRKIGYTVHRMPASHPTLGHPLDEFIEAIIAGPPGPPPNVPPPLLEKLLFALMREVGAVAKRFGGWCEQCGQVEDDYVPFTATFCGAMQVPLTETSPSALVKKTKML